MTSMSDHKDQPDLIWGASNIAKVINRSPRSTFHMLDKGALPAKKVGGMWVADRSRLLRAILDGEAA